MKIVISLACILLIVSISEALPVEADLSAANLGTQDVRETTATTLLDVDHQSAASDSGAELKRTVRGLGLGGFGKGFGGGFGGLGGKFGGLGLGGHGLGGFGHGFGGGFGHGLGGFKKIF